MTIVVQAPMDRVPHIYIGTHSKNRTVTVDERLVVQRRFPRSYIASTTNGHNQTRGVTISDEEPLRDEAPEGAICGPCDGCAIF